MTKKMFDEEIKNVPYQLPEGWKWVRLGDIAEINPKKSEIYNHNKKTHDLTVSFIPMSYLDDTKGEIIKQDEKNINEVYKGYKYFKNEDIIFAKITPCMENGKCAIAKNLINGIGFGSTEFHVIRVKENIFNKLIWSYLRLEKIKNEAKKHFTGSVGQKRVPKEFLENLLIPLPFKNNQPNLEKQKEIVERIEAIFKEIDKALTLRQKVLEETKKLFESVLNKIFKEAEKDKENWKWVILSDVLDKKAKYNLGKVKKKDYLTSGKYPIIDQGENFISGYFNNENLLYNGKLPVIIVGDHTLNIKYVDFKFIQGADGLKILIPKDKIVYPKYLYFMLNFAKPKVKSYSRHWKIIKNLLIPFPIKNNQSVLEKQKEIANYLNNLHNKIKQLDELQQIQLEKFKQLKESILNKVFRGELV